MKNPVALEDPPVLDSQLDPALSDAIARARLDASAVLSSEAAWDSVSATPRRMFTISALAHLAAAGSLKDHGAQMLADVAPADYADVAFGAVGHPVLAALPLATALGAVTGLLELLGGVRSVTLWRSDAAARLVKVFDHGSSRGGADPRGLVRKALEAGTAQTSSGRYACPVSAFGSAAAVLVWQADDPLAAGGLVRRAAVTLGAPLQHAMTADGNLEQHWALVQAPERRLTRLALDIHDGALQDVALIAGELRRLEDELRPAVAGSEHAEPVRTVLESIATLVEALDGDLRAVATSLEGPSMLKRSFSDAIDALVAKFQARSPIEAAVQTSGDLDAITDSQRITLFRVVQEALSNVREHSEAHHVLVEVKADSCGVEATIEDDGVGFEPAKVLTAAARNGRLGVLGMIERVRILGGTCEVRSRLGAGTTIAVRIARYEPVASSRRADLHVAEPTV